VATSSGMAGVVVVAAAVVAVVAWLEAWMVAAGEAGVVVEEVVPMTLGPLWWPRALQGQGPDWSGFPAPRHPHLHCHHGPWVPVTPQGERVCLWEARVPATWRCWCAAPRVCSWTARTALWR
jgi:hypothetical protein